MFLPIPKKGKAEFNPVLFNYQSAPGSPAPGGAMAPKKSSALVSEADLDGMSKSIGSVYEHAEFVGSLVLPEGDPRRPTALQKVPHEWFLW